MSPRSPKSERRRKSRKSPPSLVYVELGTENGGMLKDLSEEGFALRTMMPVRAGYKTAFSIVLDASVKIEGQGEVLWIEENGRVAGIRFVEISAEALPQIQGWLNGSLENLETKAALKSPEDPPEAKSFEELRRELHDPSSVREVPPPEQASGPLFAREESASVEPPPTAEESTPAMAEPPAFEEKTLEVKEPVTEVSEEEESPKPEPLIDPPQTTEKFPGLPDFSSTLQAIEITFDAIPPGPAPVSESFPRRRAWKELTPPLPVPEEEVPPTASRPEISKILMQPPGVEREFAMNSSISTPTDTLTRGPQPEAKWTESFTLPRAITLMALLVLLVAFVAFHRAIGDGLIWLGGALGGGAQQSGQSVAPNPTSDPTSLQSSSAPENSPAPPASSTDSAQSSATSTSRRQATSIPVPATRSIQSAPSTTGNGSTSASPAGSPQESGLQEYSKALQLLHGHKGGEDTSEAVRLLWDSVGKGNTSAELALADLYWHGEGIERNCDQARNLLTIAAGKGNADAKRQLEKFQQEGCQ